MFPCHVYPRIVHGETVLTALICGNADFTGALNMFGGSDATAHYYMLHNHQQMRQVACPSSSIVHLFVLSLKPGQVGLEEIHQECACGLSVYRFVWTRADTKAQSVS